MDLGVSLEEQVKLVALPSLARLTADSILRHDYPVVQALILLFSTVYVVVNLAVDVAYVLVDPRIRY